MDPFQSRCRGEPRGRRDGWDGLLEAAPERLSFCLAASDGLPRSRRTRSLSRTRRSGDRMPSGRESEPECRAIDCPFGCRRLEHRAFGSCRQPVPLARRIAFQRTKCRMATGVDEVPCGNRRPRGPRTVSASPGPGGGSRPSCDGLLRPENSGGPPFLDGSTLPRWTC